MPEITTLSGLQGQVRKYKPGDWHNILKDPRLTRQRTSVWENRLIKSLWQSTTNGGPYTFDGNPPWDGDVLIGDRADALIQARILTSGPKHQVDDLQCRGRVCDNQFDFTVNMGTDLTRNVLNERVRDYFLETYGETRSDGTAVNIHVVPQEAVEAITNGSNLVSLVLPGSGMEASWRLTTGTVQQRVFRFTSQHGISNMSSAAAKLVTLGDLKPGSFLPYICNDMEEDDFAYLWGEMERHEIGVDTDVEVEDNECGFQFKVNVATVNFILPDLKKQHSGMRATL